MHFSIAIVRCDTEMHSASTPMNSRGQSYVVSLNVFFQHFQRTIGPVSIKFHLQPSDSVCVCHAVCNPILLMTFPEWLSGTEPWPRTPGAMRLPSSCL